MNMRSTLAAAALAIIATLFVGAAAHANNSYNGKKFPEFTAKDAVTGESFSIEDLRGKVVLIDFWATWCGPCVRELPNVRKVYAKYKDQGFEIVSISLDSDRGRFERFVRQKDMPWRHVMEGGAWKTRLARKYGINGIPAMYLLDHNGVCISDRARGPALEQAVRKAIAEVEPMAKKTGDRDSKKSASRGETNADAADAALAEAAEARQVLAGVSTPIRSLGKRLALAGSTIDAIDRQMPNPRSPSALRRRYIAMHHELVTIRGEMYACGLLDESVPALPVNPFDDPDVPDDRGLTIAWGQLPDARLAVSELGLRINALGRQIDAAESKLDRLERRLIREPGVVTQADRAEALVEVERLATRCREAWTIQLGRAWETLAKRDDPASEGLRKEFAAIKKTLTDPAARDEHRESARKRFATLCGRMLALK